MITQQLERVVPGDDFDVRITGTLLVPAQVTEARLQVYAPDATTVLIDALITDDPGVYGQISTDGSAGPLVLDFVLPWAETAALAASSAYSWGCSVLTSTGRQYSPVPAGVLLTTPARRVPALS